MVLHIDLRQVRKKGGRIHLAVPGGSDAPARTLFNKLFEGGEYLQVEDAADCNACNRRRNDPAVVSSAFFEGDMGSTLLEMSVAQAKAENAGRAGRTQRAPSRLTPPQPRLKVVGPSAEAATPKRPRVLPNPPAAAAEEGAPEEPDLIDLHPAHLRRVSDTVYHSPAGVIVRTRRHQKGHEVAELVWDGATQVTRTSTGGVRVKLGDMVSEYDVVDGKLVARHRHKDRD